ncbi:MAG: permease [Rhodothermales bacterium]
MNSAYESTRRSTGLPSRWHKLRHALRHIPRQTWIGGGIALLLWWVFMRYTRWPAVQGKSEILTVLASGAPNTFTELVSRTGWPYWLSWIPTGINMNDNNAIGMAFAFLIGGAVASLVLPQQLIHRILLSRGTRGAAFGGLLGAPLMMCSACSVPVAIGWKRKGANLETTLGVVTGAALLNVMGLFTILVLFPGPLAWSRVAGSLLMVLVATPLTARLSRRLLDGRNPITPDREVLPGPAERAGERDVFCDTASTGNGPPGWRIAFVEAVQRWWWASVEIAYRLFLPMTAAVFLAAFIRLFLPPEVVGMHLGGGWLALTLVALFGTLIAIPTMFEIPLTIGFLFLGIGLGPAAALLFTAPSVSLVSYFMLRKDVGLAPPLLLMCATFILGTAIGLSVETVVGYFG